MASKDSVVRVLSVTGILCFICSLLVCAAVVSLRPLQAKAIKIDRESSILEAADISVEGKDIPKLFEESIESRLVSVETGDFLSAEEVTKLLGENASAEDYDFVANAKLDDKNVKIDSDKDFAKLKTISKYMPVYLVKSASGYSKVILPFYGQGLWSVMYGYLALSTDGNTILGVKYYSHGETPGLGAEIENPIWTQKWVNKKLFDDGKNYKFAVTKKVDNEAYQVDALSGATLTSNGVSTSVQFWASENGYGKLLQKIQSNGVK